MVLRRAPREVYRVYEEEDFLAGADADVGAGVPVRDEPAPICDELEPVRDELEPAGDHPEPVRHGLVPTRSGHWRRVLAATLAATVAGALFGLVAITGLRSLMQAGALRARPVAPGSARLLARGVASPRAHVVTGGPSAAGRYAHPANGRERVAAVSARDRTPAGRRRQAPAVVAALPTGGLSASSGVPIPEQSEFGFEQ
jgi:hypothetical protein